MLKPPAPTMPGMTDTLDFVKNLWGSMNIPGAGVPGMSGLAGPTLSTDDLDKRIADLKAVESWLNMNLTMLRGTIQAMEVQRGTLAALKSMSASMAEAMRQSGVGADKMAAMPFASFFNPAGQAAVSAKPAASASTSASAPSPTSGSGAPAGADASTASAAAAMGMPAAVAWWNMLQEQFTQAVSSAMGSTASGAPAATASSAVPPSASTGAPFPPDPSDAPPAPASDAPSEPTAGNNGGKTRTSRSRTDKA